MDTFTKLMSKFGLNVEFVDSLPQHLEPSEQSFIKWITNELDQCTKLTGEAKTRFDEMRRKGACYNQSEIEEISRKVKASNDHKEQLLRRDISDVSSQLVSLQAHLKTLDGLHSNLSSEYKDCLSEQERLTKCLTQCQREYTKLNQDMKNLNTETNEALVRLEQAMDGVKDIYSPKKSEGDKTTSILFSDCSQSEYHQSESVFLKQLTDYAKQQFSPGINEVVNSLPSGDHDETVDEKVSFPVQKKELERLEKILPLCELQLINEKVGVAYREAVVKRLEDEIHSLKNGRSKVDKALNNATVFLEDSITGYKDRIQDCVDQRLVPLVQDMGTVLVTNVMHGNLDMKLARQALFTAIQDQIVEQLKCQKVRYKVVGMLLEADLNNHRNSYQLVQAARSQLELWQEQNKTRMVDVENSRETTSNTSWQGDTDQGFSACELELDQMTKDNPAVDMVSLIKEQRDLIDNGISLYTDVCGCVHDEAIPELQPMVYRKSVNDLDRLLGSLELKMKELLKEHSQKKKTIQCSPLLQTERSIFAHFFLNPSHLAQVTSDLASRVNSRMISSPADES